MKISRRREPGLSSIPSMVMKTEAGITIPLPVAQRFVQIFGRPGRIEYGMIASAATAVKLEERSKLSEFKDSFADAYSSEFEFMAAAFAAVQPSMLFCSACNHFAMKREGAIYVPINAGIQCPTQFEKGKSCGELLKDSSQDPTHHVAWPYGKGIMVKIDQDRIRLEDSHYTDEFPLTNDGIAELLQRRYLVPVHSLVNEVCGIEEGGSYKLSYGDLLDHLVTISSCHGDPMKALKTLGGNTDLLNMGDMRGIAVKAAEKASKRGKSETPKVSEVPKVSKVLTSLHLPGVPKIFVLSTKSDSSHLQKFNTHMFLCARIRKSVSLRSTAECPVGDDLSSFIEREIEDADIVVIFISPKFIEDYYDIVLRAIKLKKRVVPVLLTDCDWRKAAFGGLRPLPRNERPIENWNDADSAWLDVTSGLTLVSESVPKK